MSRRKFSATMTALGALAFAAGAGVALAHETDVHHWFDHQRALSDGGDVFIESGSPAMARPSNGDPSIPRASGSKGGVATATPDCISEQLQMAEGYMPSGACEGEHAARRRMADDRRELGRQAERAR